MTESEYNNLWHRAMPYIRHRVPECDIEDYVQDAIVKTWLAQPDNDIAYCITCAKNAVIDWWRTRSANPPPSELDEEMPWSEAEHRTEMEAISNMAIEELLEQDWDAEIMYCLATMHYGWRDAKSYKDRHVVRRRPSDGEYQEIADYLGTSYGAVKSRIARLRGRLQACHAEEVLVS